MAFDLRSRQVPAVLTIPLLVLSALWRLLQGRWRLVVLVATLILISDFSWLMWRITLNRLVSVLVWSIHAFSERVYAILVIFAAWAL